MTRMSSKTAAPSRASPTRVFNWLSSINTCAEMDTEVAPRVSPKKRPWLKSMPVISPKRRPRPTGKTTPSTPARAATRVFLARSFRCSSRPARNIKSKTPSSPRSAMKLSMCVLLMNERWVRFSSVGPSNKPTSNSPKTEG
ncbi:hypothetical protein SDC9_162240 [bioreactor metagenome]|uniref:Uncharacterized protein n=1 Tax=bioreactor metagenome TaxID=1076179 RepID=A0A645FKJ9_9ZZZZ